MSAFGNELAILGGAINKIVRAITAVSGLYRAFANVGNGFKWE